MPAVRVGQCCMHVFTFVCWSAAACRKKRVNQMYLMAMLEMGIPKHKAEVALTETGNVGVEVATEWLFSAPETAGQFDHYTSDTGGWPQGATVVHAGCLPHCRRQ